MLKLKSSYNPYTIKLKIVLHDFVKYFWHIKKYDIQKPKKRDLLLLLDKHNLDSNDYFFRNCLALFYFEFWTRERMKFLPEGRDINQFLIYYYHNSFSKTESMEVHKLLYLPGSVFF